jgi:endonuclease/exonuclease/phosphatase (EEP) superfamily protein YafD
VGTAELGVKLDEIPIILGGDFNINFAPDDAKPLIQFLEEKLSLRMNNSPTESTTRHGTTIDAVFSRFLENLESRVFITYFSCHKPIISSLKNEEDDAQ